MKMSFDFQALRAQLHAGDIENFLFSLEELSVQARGHIELTTLTQTVLPPILRIWLNAPQIRSAALVRLWRLLRSGNLLIVENDLISAVNLKIDDAWQCVYGCSVALPAKLLLFPETTEICSPNVRTTIPTCCATEISMRRIVLRSTFTLSFVRVGDITAAKRNLCSSSQEREFLKAVRQFLPNAWAYPNVPLRSFIDIDRMAPPPSERHRYYCKRAQVDVLLCTHDEDPIAGFELDSALHDSEIVKERDKLKNQLFSLAGIPLIRIRAADTSGVRAEDFYDLLMARSDIFDQLRPDRIMPRRNHDSLVPTGAG